ncbi:Octicosapeptide Phox Bem1p family isoform 1 [Olea europaea subsp. europaea]|uniref:Octicosapeptide Phox Bem1p family isoform 1 n=1 Tax=Olea europaea subsp. europaea TaxID=158383 RepID=A0A8S0R470_OLEEU|nr:Octicosapeptide Phox Bem1p family isoform 1 [Olea europaea subsp. europaea]
MLEPSLNTLKPTATIKFLCSYGGRILPRYPDGKLRYHGGETRVLSIDRSISYAELVVKLRDMCGTSSMSLRCQLPTEDSDALVSITSDEDLATLFEEYDQATAAPPASIKIRAFLSTPKATNKVLPPPSSASLSSSSSNDATSTKSIYYTTATLPPRCPTSNTGHCTRYASKPPVSPPCKGAATARQLPKFAYRHVHGNKNGQVYLIHHGNHCQ